jgi:hypothetical protein
MDDKDNCVDSGIGQIHPYRNPWESHRNPTELLGSGNVERTASFRTASATDFASN